MRDHRLGYRVWRIATFKYTDHAPPAPPFGPFNNRAGERADVVQRQREGTQRVTFETIESGADQHQLRREVGRCRVNGGE